LTDGVRMSRTRNRVNGVQKLTSRRRTATARGHEGSRDKDAVTHGRRYAKYVRPTTQSDNFRGYSHSPLSNSYLNSTTIVRRSQLFTTRLLSFTVSRRLSYDVRSLRRSLTYICTLQLTQVISCKSLTDTSTYGTYTQARAQYRRPAGETRPHQLCSVV